MLQVKESCRQQRHLILEKFLALFVVPINTNKYRLSPLKMVKNLFLINLICGMQDHLQQSLGFKSRYRKQNLKSIKLAVKAALEVSVSRIGGDREPFVRQSEASAHLEAPIYLRGHRDLLLPNVCWSSSPARYRVTAIEIINSVNSIKYPLNLTPPPSLPRGPGPRGTALKLVKI